MTGKLQGQRVESNEIDEKLLLFDSGFLHFSDSKFQSFQDFFPIDVLQFERFDCIGASLRAHSLPDETWKSEHV